MFFHGLGIGSTGDDSERVFSGFERCFSKPDLSGVTYAAGLKEVLRFSEGTAINGEGMDAVVDGFGSGKINLKFPGGGDGELDGEFGVLFLGDPPELRISAPDSCAE